MGDNDTEDANGDDGTTTDATSTDTDNTQGDGTADLGDAGKKALAAERERAKAAEKKAKELETELEEFRRSQMTDQEKAIDEAKAAGRAEALAETGSKVAVAEFKAAAAGRIGDEDLREILAHLDVQGFLTNGEVDAEKVKTFVDRIAPEKGAGHLDLGQGARGGGAGPVDPLLASVQAISGR